MSYLTPLHGNKPAQIPIQRILIVEDDPVMQLGLTQFFEEYPQFQIVGIAADGYTGVEVAIKLQPHLAIVDIGLPQLDGIAATKQIKANLPNVRVVILTSHSDESSKSILQHQMGIAPHNNKPTRRHRNWFRQTL